MNIENLQIGMKIRNYKEMASVLNEKVTTGQGKQIQLSNWERYFSWDKEGYSFVIREIYDEPLPKPNDKRSLGNNNVYAKYIEILVMDLLSHQKDYTLICTRNWLLANLGIVNYKYASKRQREIATKTCDFKEEELNEWFSRAWEKTDQILFSALNNLKRRCLLDYSKEYEITVVDESVLSNESSHFATDTEKQQFLTVKRETLNEMTRKHQSDKYPKVFDSMKDLYPNHYKEYYDTLEDKMWEMNKWLKVETKYKLIYNQKHLIQAIPTTEIQLQKLELNNKVVDAMHNDANTKATNSLQKFKDEYALLCETWFGKPPEAMCKSYKFIKPANYVEIQDKISEIFIRLPKEKERNNVVEYNTI
jgi:hypothetical protein